MIDLTELRVSLTKNGYFKVAELLKAHSSAEVLDHLYGDYEGINLVRSQVANMLDASDTTGDVPEYWDAVRPHGFHAIDAFAVVAMLFSHHKFIRLFQQASKDRPEFTGYFLRTDLSSKEYTNIAYALACFGLCRYRRGAGAVEYNLAPAVYHLRALGNLVRDLLRVKLRRAGWRDPERIRLAPDRDLMTELRAHEFHRVMSMSWERFEAWLGGRLRMAAPPGEFGLRDVGLFGTPIPLPESD